MREGYWDDVATRAQQRQRLEAISTAARAAIPDLQFANNQAQRRVDIAFDVAEEARLSSADVARLVALIESHGARSLVSSVHAHAFFGAHDKATGAVRAVARR